MVMHFLWRFRAVVIVLRATNCVNFQENEMYDVKRFFDKGNILDKRKLLGRNFVLEVES